MSEIPVRCVTADDLHDLVDQLPKLAFASEETESRLEAKRRIEIALNYYRSTLAQADAEFFFGEKVTLVQGWSQQSLGPLLIFGEQYCPVVCVPDFQGRYHNCGSRRLIDEQGYRHDGFPVLLRMPASKISYIQLLRLLVARIKRNMAWSIFAMSALSILGLVPSLILYRLSLVSSRTQSKMFYLELICALVCYLIALPIYSALYARLATASFVRLDREAIPSFWRRTLNIPAFSWKSIRAETVDDAFTQMLSQRSLGIAMVFPGVVAILQMIPILLAFLHKTHRGLTFIVSFILIRVIVSIFICQRASVMQLLVLRTSQSWRRLLEESIAGIVTIKSYKIESLVTGRLKASAKSRSLALSRFQRLSLLNDLVTGGSGLLFLGLWCLLMFGTAKTASSTSDRILLLSLFAQLIYSLTQMERVISFFMQLSIAKESLNPVLTEAVPPSVADSTVDSAPFNQLEVSNLSFSYSDRSRLFQNFSLSIERGELVGLVGPSGSGKTTIVNIILGITEPVSGSVRWNDQLISRFSPPSVRRDVGVILQGATPNGKDIEAAVCQGVRFPSDRIWWALQMACFDEEVRKMPLQLSTPIGEGGVLLSGGQRQRLLVAGALISRPGLLILDEALSAVDGVATENIMNNFRELRIAALLIAHREGMFDQANRIYHVEDEIGQAEGWPTSPTQYVRQAKSSARRQNDFLFSA